MKKICQIAHLLLWVLFLFLMLFSIATNPFANTSSGDSAIFSYVGLRWCEGFVPYRDYFDHKGPMIFLINMLGQLPGHCFFFLWLIECAFALSGIWFIYKFVRCHFKKVNPLAVELPVAAIGWTYLSSCYGNMNECYAFLFITAVLLSLLGYVMQGREVPRSMAFLYGCAFMTIFLFRANMVVVALVVAVFYIADFAGTGNCRTFLWRCGLTFAGMTVVLAPFVLYFHLNGALYDMWYASILFNLKYADQTWHWTWCFYPLIAIGALNVWLLRWECDPGLKRGLYYNLLFVGLTALVLFKQPFYPHYFVVMLPGIVLPAAVFLNECNSQKKIVESAILLPSYGLMTLALLGANLDLGGYAKFVRDGGDIMAILRFKEGLQFASVKRFKERIKDLTSVFVYGNQSHLYQYLGVRGSFKYFAHTVGDAHIYDPTIKEQVLAHVNGVKDRYVITVNGSGEGDVLSAIGRNYLKKDDVGQYILWERKW